MRNILLSITAVCLTAFTTATFANNSAFHVIGWQNFDTVSPGLNDSGINDDSPDTNSTFDATPIGTHADNLYLSIKGLVIKQVLLLSMTVTTDQVYLART